MATIKSVLALEDKMSSTLSNIDKNMEKLINAMEQGDKGVKQLGNSMNKSSKSSGSFLGSLLKFSAVSKIFNMITGQIGSAINRFDTLNNYTNVMSGLGFGAEESQASIDRLKDGLDGLPTTLDEAVSSVQRFAAVNENIAASTEMTLALNDALAAGGTPAATQAAALEQISQAYAKGKFDAMEYKSMMNAMPAQLKQVAKQMGYTSTALGGDFYNALQKGKIGMNDMMKTFVELDKSQGGFHDQALKATAGIKTAFINMKTAITKGLTDMIDNMNKALEKANLPTIQEMITKTGKMIQTGLANLGNTIANFIVFIAPIVNFLKENIELIEMLVIVMRLWSAATQVMAGAQALLNSQLLIPIIIIGLIIGIIYGVIEIINELTGQSISAIGTITGTIAMMGAFIYNVAVGIYDVFAWVVNGIIAVFASMASIVIGFIDMIAGAIDFVFGSNLQATTSGWLNNTVGTVSKALSNEGVVGYGEFADMDKAFDKGYGFGEGLSLNNAFKKGAGGNKSTNEYLADWNNMANNVTGDSNKGKAVKTTNADDNLLGDEDIKLLLDIATRDYQLNYQQVTPNVSVTFGDVRETADIDNVLDEVGNRIYDLIYADAEVPIG